MQIWKHTRSAPTITLSTKCAWILRKAMSLMERAMNRNSPNMWDHMLICEREKLLNAEQWCESLQFHLSTRKSTPSRASTGALCDILCGWMGWTGGTKAPEKSRQHTRATALQVNSHHHSPRAVGTYDNSPHARSRALPFPSLDAPSQSDYHRFLWNYYYCYYNNYAYS